jgi:NAD(P)-dependent dehydrogenase (short-subunit alcohol dehydrogenase family)
MRLLGKVAIVTGGASGIGAEIAKVFSSEGATVIIGDIDDELGSAVVNSLISKGAEAMYSHLDVRSERDWNRMIGHTVERFQKVDVLVNNAGISGAAWHMKLDIQAWDAVMNVNIFGCLLGIQMVIPHMIDLGFGSIINMSSQMGLVGSTSTHPSYNASKGAVRALSKGIAVQYAKENIRCNSIHPGPIDTAMASDIFKNPDLMSGALSKIPLGRIGNTCDVAYGALFLASDESSYITGSELVIDGGWTAY